MMLLTHITCSYFAIRSDRTCSAGYCRSNFAVACAFAGRLNGPILGYQVRLLTVRNDWLERRKLNAALHLCLYQATAAAMFTTITSFNSIWCCARIRQSLAICTCMIYCVTFHLTHWGYGLRSHVSFSYASFYYCWCECCVGSAIGSCDSVQSCLFHDNV